MEDLVMEQDCPRNFLRHFFTFMLVLLLASLTGCGGGPPASDDSASAPPASAPPPRLPPASDPPAVEIRATRAFAGPGQYPPKDFAAYGIIAFRAAVTPDSLNRYLAICRGFLAGIPAATELEDLGVPMKQQMATVWPLDSQDFATYLNRTNVSLALEECNDIVALVDLPTSLDAIKKASRSSGKEFTAQGPYLLAWSPSLTMGDPGALVLVWDLSDVTNVTQATRMFTDWAVEIERDPSLWNQGWNLENLRTKLRLWADKYGQGVLKMLDSMN